LGTTIGQEQQLTFKSKVRIMTYLLLCCHEEKEFDAMSKSECDAMMEETMAYCEALKKTGQLLAVEQLESIQAAMTVRVRKGKAAVTDGPFAETKEQLGGYFLIDARDALNVGAGGAASEWTGYVDSWKGAPTPSDAGKA
jgi:hypothetical protein